MSDHGKYFLPYQRRWLSDRSMIKVWEKSRRIGATYAQSYEDVEDLIFKHCYMHGRPVTKVFFTSADESAGREYMDYCAQWAKLYNAAAEYLGEIILDSERDIKALSMKLANGGQIFALTSNPKRFRSKGGKIVWDEAAHHEDPAELWKAAKPAAMWGYPIRIISTHNGQQALFYRFVEDTKRGKTGWSLHTVTLADAVEDGLLDKIFGRPTTQEEREAWLEEEHKNCRDEDTWQQEYMCVAVDAASAFLEYTLMAPCEADDVLKPLEEATGILFGGIDIGRKKDLTVFWVLEELGKVLYPRRVLPLYRMRFADQKAIIWPILRHPLMRRTCIDNTGLGMQLAEEAEDEFGSYRIEGITFNERVKEELAYPVRRRFEDRQIWIPADEIIRSDLHSVKKVMTALGKVRFDVEKSESAGHADYFWGLALGVHAGGSGKSGGIPTIASRRPREAYELLRGY